MIKSGYEPKLVGPKSENHLSKFPINWHPFVVAWDTTLAVEALGVLVTHCAPDPAPLAACFCPCSFHLPKGLHSLPGGGGEGLLHFPGTDQHRRPYPAEVSPRSQLHQLSLD